MIVFFAGSSRLSVAPAWAADIPPRATVATVPPDSSQPKYYWRSVELQGAELEGGAQILTLFCRMSSPSSDDIEDVPLVAVLRDTLGDGDTKNDRLRYVWLLSYIRPSWDQKALSAVPFFYWRVGGRNKSVKYKVPKALIDISQPASPILSRVTRQVLQWSLFDSMMMPVRASTRTYQTNALDNERLHLEEAIGYLRQAPDAGAGPIDSSALTQSELNTVIARLSLRTNLLGGLVSEQRAEKMGESDGFAQETIRSRNLETLRACAEKAGLILEPINLAGHPDQYAVLWYPVDRRFPRADSPLNTVWKVLSVRDPAGDTRLRDWDGSRFERALDANGTLLPPGVSGTPVQLIPLAVYGMNYPRRPLLLTDFRDTHRVRLREITQRLINDTATGILGLSHFTNWYFFVGEDVYNFLRSHRGGAVSRLARLDCYSQFRVELALDHSLDPALRKEMQKHVNSMALNPLEVAPGREIAVAQAHYLALTGDAAIEAKGKLAKRLGADRRLELAEFGRTEKQKISDALLRQATFGIYSRRAKQSSVNVLALQRERRISHDLAFLDKLVHAGTDPEVTYPVERIRDSVNTLAELTPGVRVHQIREHAATTIDALKTITSDPLLQADCTRAIAGIKTGPRLLDAGAGMGLTKMDIASAKDAGAAK